MNRIGIFSGIFNPIHSGHIAACLDAKQQFKLNEVVLMIERVPRRKTGVAPYDARYEMALLATRKHPHITPLYSKRLQFNVKDTMPFLKNRYARQALFFIMGSDMLSHLPEWPDVGELLREVTLLIALRDDDEEQISKTIINLAKRESHLRSYTFLSPEPLVASSKIRQQLAAEGTSENLDPAVLGYIKQNGLYSSPKAA